MHIAHNVCGGVITQKGIERFIMVTLHSTERRKTKLLRKSLSPIVGVFIGPGNSSIHAGFQVQSLCDCGMVIQGTIECIHTHFNAAFCAGIVVRYCYNRRLRSLIMVAIYNNRCAMRRIELVSVNV